MSDEHEIVQRLRSMPSNLNDALRTMDEAANEIELLHDALKRIYTVAVAKKKGSAREMQWIARDALVGKDAANVR